MKSPAEVWAAVESWSPEITYTPDPHGATDAQGRPFMGVNRMIKQYCEPFDPVRISNMIVKRHFSYLSDEEQEAKAAGYRADWDNRRQRGIDFSTAMEAAWKGQPFDPQWQAHVEDSLSWIQDRYPMDKVRPELMLWHTAARIWGFADVVVFDGAKVHVYDYKLVKEIRSKGMFGLMMAPPFERFPDANGSHYALQISAYAYFLELQGYEIGTLAILHVNELGQAKEIPVPYEREAVEQMLYLRIVSLENE
jgi:hypothetical protein